MAREQDIFKLDLYQILGVEEEATEKEIVKGYRKKALKCHPDKNPDNPKAAELFHQLSRALEILTDAAAKAAYDRTRKAKKAADERNKVLDSKRKKFKEDLEAREQAVNERNRNSDAVKAENEKKLQREIDRLRKEGSRLLEQEQEKLREELKRAKQAEEMSTSSVGETPRIKLRWKAQKGDGNNGGYSCETLKHILNCYGTVSTLLVSDKRNGSAVAEFEGRVSSDINHENGLQNNPLTITWLAGKPEEILNSSETSGPDHFSDSFANVAAAGFSNSSSIGHSSAWGRNSDEDNFSSASVPAENCKDFESVVLMKMRQAEERKRLIEQMTKEDKEDE